MLTQALLKTVLHYDPETGVFRWLERSEDMSKATIFTKKHATSTINARCAGEVAGSVNKKGYRRITVLGKSYGAQNLAWLYMTGVWPKARVDHRNLQRGDDRWLNLREATEQQNSINRGVRADSHTGLKGVKPHEGRFQARITKIDKKRISLGLFDCPVAAHLAYVVAADIHHGAFAQPGVGVR